jgi:uncharacterized protein YqhQ
MKTNTLQLFVLMLTMTVSVIGMVSLLLQPEMVQVVPVLGSIFLITFAMSAIMLIKEGRN